MLESHIYFAFYKRLWYEYLYYFIIFRRKIYDEYNDEEVELTKEETKLIHRLLEGKAPHADFDPYQVCALPYFFLCFGFSVFWNLDLCNSSNIYLWRSCLLKKFLMVLVCFLQPYVDFFAWDDSKHPLSNAPEPKRRFIPSKWESKKVNYNEAYCFLVKQFLISNISSRHTVKISLYLLLWLFHKCIMKLKISYMCSQTKLDSSRTSSFWDDIVFCKRKKKRSFCIQKYTNLNKLFILCWIALEVITDKRNDPFYNIKLYLFHTVHVTLSHDTAYGRYRINRKLRHMSVSYFACATYLCFLQIIKMWIKLFVVPFYQWNDSWEVFLWTFCMLAFWYYKYYLLGNWCDKMLARVSIGIFFLCEAPAFIFITREEKINK